MTIAVWKHPITRAPALSSDMVFYILAKTNPSRKVSIMDFILGALNLMMVPALLMLFVGLIYFGFAILHFEYTQSKSQLNTDNLTENEIYDWAKDPGFLHEEGKK